MQKDSQVKPHFKSFVSAVALTTFILAGCSSNKEKPYEEQTVAELYNKAMDKLEEGEFKESATLFDEVTRQHPYSQWAQRAQIMEAYAHYRGQRYDNVIASMQAFIGLHPAHPDVPYALYLTGLSYFEQINPSVRDQQDTTDALRTFTELMNRFPNSNYAKDAREKIIFINDLIAEKSMEIGRFYQTQDAHQSAIKRFQLVIQRHQKTRHIEEALHRAVESYVAMGLRDAAINTAAVLGHNYPGGKWYQASYALLKGDSVEKLAKQKPQSSESKTQN